MDLIVTLHHHDIGRPSADRFKTNRSNSGEEIEHPGIFEPTPQQIEDRFLHSSRHGSRTNAIRGFSKLSAAEFTTQYFKHEQILRAYLTACLPPSMGACQSPENFIRLLIGTAGS